MHCGPYVGCAGGSPTLDAEAEMSEAEFERLFQIPERAKQCLTDPANAAIFSTQLSGGAGGATYGGFAPPTAAPPPSISQDQFVALVNAQAQQQCYYPTVETGAPSAMPIEAVPPGGATPTATTDAPTMWPTFASCTLSAHEVLDP